MKFLLVLAIAACANPALAQQPAREAERYRGVDDGRVNPRSSGRYHDAEQRVHCPYGVEKQGKKGYTCKPNPQGTRPGDPNPHATRAGDPNPFATKAGAPNPYATRAGDPNPYATRAGEPNPYATRAGTRNPAAPPPAGTPKR